jgi:hypothetical protein
MPHLTPDSPSRSQTRSRAKTPQIDLNQPGRLSLGNMLALFNVSAATFYAGLKSGRYPSPDGHDGRRPFWKTATALAALT